MRNSISPAQFGQIFSTIRSAIDKIMAADKLAGAMNQSITCAHIAEAVSRSEEFIRTDIINKLAPKCVDKMNKEQVRAVLTPFQFICVESAFN
jgi:hypothetical protein